MLSAFTARPIVEFKQRDKNKIESILAYGDRVLVGLQSGALRIYRVNEPHEQADGAAPTNGDHAEPARPRLADLLREEEKFSKSKVQQLAIIKEANILLCLAGGYVHVYDMQSYALQETLDKTKSATVFAVTSNIVKDPTTGIPSIVSKLAVAVKRKILLWSWQDMELAEEVKELTLIATVKSMTWATGTTMVVGMDPGFVMVNVETDEISDINKPTALGDTGKDGSARFGAVSTSGMGYMGMSGWIPKPMATRLQEGGMLLAKDVNTLFIDAKGKAIEKRQIPWPAAPESIGYSYPYMLALSAPAKGALEIRNPDTLSLLQSIALPNASFLHVPQPNISLAHAGKGFLVASDRVIWRMGALDYDTQIQDLIQSGRYDEAISLLNMLEDTLLKDKVGQLREVRMLKAQGLFHQRKYADAMDLFSEAHAPPELVIALYPKAIAGELSSFEGTEAAEDGKTDEEPAEPTETNGSASTSPVKKSVGAASTLGRAMFGKWKAEHKKADSDAGSTMSEKPEADDATSSKTKGASTANQDIPLEGRDLKVAVHKLTWFLADSRTKIQKYIDFDGELKQPLPQKIDPEVEVERPPFHELITASPGEEIDWQKKLLEVATTVDTVLFRAYMLASPSMAGPLFRLDNFCDTAVVKEKLYEVGRYADLIDFLHGKKLHREALEVLAKFGKSEADAEVAPALKGPARTVGYLQQLPPELVDIILEFAQWPLRTNPEEGMKVFLADSRNAEELPRHTVEEYLEKLDTNLAVQYLEHIIFELNDMTPHFHQKLIDLYLQRLKAKGSGEHGEFESKEEREEWIEKLLRMLKESSQYHKGKAFGLLPADDPTFYEARAIVLSHMGQHKQALQIYVFQIKDFAKAEDYCNRIFLTTHPLDSATQAPTSHTPDDPNSSVEPSIYHTLLSLYLQPPHPHSPNLPPALSLLSRHGARLPAQSTLGLIPTDLPVSQLQSYFVGRIRTANSVLNQERILARLRSVVKDDVEAALLLGDQNAAASIAANSNGRGANLKGPGGRNRRVVVGEDRHCSVCGKRFGGSAIRVWPDNGVTHYGCVRSTGGKDAEKERERGSSPENARRRVEDWRRSSGWR